MERDAPMPNAVIDRSSHEESLEHPAMARSDVDGTLEQPIPALSGDAADDEAESDDSLSTFDGEDETDASNSPSYEEELFLISGDCRICHEPELDEANDTHPVIRVGCDCKGDRSIGHELCLKRWFVPQLLKTGKMVCEFCRGDLGAELKQIILTRDDIGERVIPEANPQILFLLQVPPEELDRLQVPIDSPQFTALPPHTQIAIDGLLRTLEDQQSCEQIRRGEIQETAMFRDAHGVGDRALPSRITRASQLLPHGFIMMKHVCVRMENAEEPVHAYIPRNAGPVGADMNIRILMEEDLRPREILDPGRELSHRGEMLRVAVEQGQDGQAPDVDALLDELAVHADLIAKDDLSMIMLPRSMVVENIFINWAPNNIVVRPVPLAEQRAPHGRRQFTYGRYQRLYLFKFQIVF